MIWFSCNKHVLPRYSVSSCTLTSSFTFVFVTCMIAEVQEGHACYNSSHAVICLVVSCMHGGVAYTAKTPGLLLPHFRLSELHQCDQGMLPNRFFESSLRNVFSSISYLATFLAFWTPQPCNQGTIQGQLCRIKRNNKPHQKCWLYM